MKKLLIILAIVVLIVGAAGAGVFAWSRAKVQSADANATPVRIEPAIRGDLVELVQAPGEIQPKTKVSISARVAARISKLPFKERDQVKEGDVVVRLDDTDLKAALDAANARKHAQEAQVEAAKARQRAQVAMKAQYEAQRDEAVYALERQQRLSTSGDTTVESLQAAERRVREINAQLKSNEATILAEEANVNAAEHNVKAAEAEIARATDNLSYAEIKSPIDGQITRINAKEGELVVTGTMNNAGTVIMEIGDFNEKLMVARVDEANVATLKPGQRAQIHTQAYGDMVFTGTVDTVALSQSGNAQAQLSGSSAGKYFKVEVLLDKDQAVDFAGLTADVDIETVRHNNVLKLPSQAVLGRSTDELPAQIRDGNPNVHRTTAQTTVVYRAIDGKAVVTPVTVGPSDLTHTMIKSGLSEGDLIITGPYKALEKIAHDQKIKDEKATTKPSTQPTTQASRA